MTMGRAAVEYRELRFVSEEQGSLFDKEGISRVEISSGSKSVTLTNKTRKKIAAALEKESA